MIETLDANPHAGVARIEDGELAGIVNEYFESADNRPWHRFKDFDWASIATDRLTVDQRAAVSFITCIEDHLPGYFAEYHRLFPVDDTVVSEDFVHNRELYRFTVRWAQEEDCHAHVLFTYQVKAGLATAEQLRRDLAVEGRKRFTLPHSQPVEILTYTLLQEKATQLYYQRLASVVEEPVLRSILMHLTRDEARHFAFFARLLEVYIRRFGAQLFPSMKDVVKRFKMPLADTMKNYWRRSLRIADAAEGYDHTEAYEELIRVVRRAADAPTWSKASDLVDFVQRLRAV